MGAWLGHWLIYLSIVLFPAAFVYGVIASYIGDWRPSRVLRVFKL